MRGTLIAIAAVLGAIGIGVGAVAVVGPPTYGTTEMTFHAVFPGTPRFVHVADGHVDFSGWELIETSGYAYAVTLQRQLPGTEVPDEKELRAEYPDLRAHWVAFAPLATKNACGPTTVTVRRGGQSVTEHFAMVIDQRGAKTPLCDGVLDYRSGSLMFQASALGPLSGVAQFIASVTPLNSPQPAR